MFVFAIETGGRTVAFIRETHRIMLDGILNDDRDEGRKLREGLTYLKEWDCISGFTARLATESEELQYDAAALEYGLYNDLLLQTKNEIDQAVLVIPPDAKYVRRLEEAEESIRHLVEQGLIVDSGQKRRSSHTGQLSTVWRKCAQEPEQGG